MPRIYQRKILAPDEAGNLQCKRCGENKPIASFGRKPDGRWKSNCKECLNVLLHEYRARLPKPEPKNVSPYEQTHNAREAKAQRKANAEWKEKDYRAIISTGRIIRRLQKHALGVEEMNNSAVRAAIALLDRVVPVLQSVEVKGSMEHRFVIEVPAVSLSALHWEADTQSAQLGRQPSQTLEHSNT